MAVPTAKIVLEKDAITGNKVLLGVLHYILHPDLFIKYYFVANSGNLTCQIHDQDLISNLPTLHKKNVILRVGVYFIETDTMLWYDEVTKEVGLVSPKVHSCTPQ